MHSGSVDRPCNLARYDDVSDLREIDTADVSAKRLKRTVEEKRRIVEATFAPGAVGCRGGSRAWSQRELALTAHRDHRSGCVSVRKQKRPGPARYCWLVEDRTSLSGLAAGTVLPLYIWALSDCGAIPGRDLDQ
jgi:hypothetical protein